MRTLRTCYSFKKLVSRSLCTVISESNTVSKNLSDLAKQLKVNDEALAKIINKDVEKFSSYSDSRWLVTIEYLKQYDFKTSELLEMIDSNPDVLSISRPNLHKCMCAWTNFRFDDKKLRQLLVTQPSFLLLDDKEILSRIPKFLAYVGNKHNRVLELLSYSPNIMFDSWKHLESKLDYILLDMELGPVQFVTTSIMSLTFFDLKCRHNFLVRLGMYKKRDPKANPKQLTGNPSAQKIAQTSDKQFAIKVGGVTAEEYFVFKKLYKKQLEREEDDSVDDQSQDDYLD